MANSTGYIGWGIGVSQGLAVVRGGEGSPVSNSHRIARARMEKEEQTTSLPWFAASQACGHRRGAAGPRVLGGVAELQLRGGVARGRRPQAPIGEHCCARLAMVGLRSLPSWLRDRPRRWNGGSASAQRHDAAEYGGAGWRRR